MAEPMVASAAAIDIIKIEKISPFICELSIKLEKVTRFILTALRTNSKHISALTIFLLVINPKIPIQNIKALKLRICSSIKTLPYEIIFLI